MNDVQRYLIVNSDDFGLSQGVNAGIIRAHQHGILTSTSLMVRWPAAASAANSARKNPKLSVGLHVDLAEWVFENWDWKPKYQVVSTDDEKAVRGEVARQIESFQKLMGRKPTHIDSHQHVHRSEPVRSVLVEAAAQLNVPLRDYHDSIRFVGGFYGQTGEGDPYPEGISLDNLLKMIDGLTEGWTELSCHAGDDDTLDSVYRVERKLELNVLCDPRVRAEIESQKIQLCSFADFTQFQLRQQES